MWYLLIDEIVRISRKETISRRTFCGNQLCPLETYTYFRYTCIRSERIFVVVVVGRSREIRIHVLHNINGFALARCTQDLVIIVFGIVNPFRCENLLKRVY